MLTLQNVAARISVSGSSGSLRELANLSSGDNHLKWPDQLSGPPLRLTCLGTKGERLVLIPGPAVSSRLTAVPGGNRMVVEHATCVIGQMEYAVRCTWRVTLPDDDELVRGPGDTQGTLSSWEVVVDNRSPLRVVEVLFPYLRGLLLGSSYQDDTLIYPHHAGEKIENPVEALVSPRYREFSRANTVVETNGTFSREINYCGLASMAWLDYYDPEGGLYLASYDPDFPLTGLRHETGGPRAPWTGFALRKYVPARPGESWTSAPSVVGVHSGDWHWAARQYRQWALQHLRLPQVPEDLKQQSALCPRYDFRQDQLVHHRFTEIPAMFDQAKAEGIRHFLIAGWNRQGFDTNYPEYLPDMELGSSWDLAAGLRYIRERGGFTTFYINARLFDQGSEYFEPLGRAWALKDPQGRLISEVYPPAAFAVMCPACSGWQRWINDSAGWMVRSFGARGIYLDQLGSARPLPCYDESHDHRDARGGHHHGLFNQGYLTILREVSARLASLDPASFLMIENCGDIYSQFVYANLTWNGNPYDEFFNLYKYTFPEFLQVNMVNPRKLPSRALREAWFHPDLTRAFVLGSIFWVELERFGPEDETLLPYVRQALRLREAAASYLAVATFEDDLGLTLPPPLYASAARQGPPYCDLGRITASRWRLPGGGWLVLAANPLAQQGQEVLLSPSAMAGPTWAPGTQFRLEICHLNLARETRRLTAGRDGSLRIPLSPSRLSFVVLTPGGEGCTA